MRISDWSSDVCSSDLPLPANDDDALEGLAPLVPIAADESAHVAGDVDALAGKYQVINIKLDKTGGLTGALALADAAAAAGLGVMTGSMSRSEEHTSELQSLMRISYAVFCLKKKKTD